MKGAWLLNLVIQTARRKFTVKEAVAFSTARIKHKPISFKFSGILFGNVDHVFWSILADVFVNRVYTPPGMEIGQTDVVVDIGAHRGGFTGYAAMKNCSMVHAYEPDPNNFKLLCQLVKMNGLKNVTPNNVAVASATGSAILYLSATSSRHTLHGIDVVTGRTITETIDVPAVSLDDCLKEISRVDLLKMDCEGAEIEILMAASDETLAKIRKLSAEIHDPVDSDEIKQLQTRLHAFFSFIEVTSQDRANLGYLYARQ